VSFSRASSRPLIYLVFGVAAATRLILRADAAAPPEYPASEAYQHIGETARLVGMVDCLGNGRRHTDVLLGGCLPHSLLWVVVPNDAAGPELDLWKLRGVTIAVTGKIESSGQIPQITVQSTNQIMPRPSHELNYLASANEKQNKGNLDGASADLDLAVEQSHDPGAYIELARVKEKQGDVAGAIEAYDELIERSPETYAASRAEYYNSRAQLKIKSADFGGATADADRAIQLNPRVPWHYATRGQADEAKGDFAAAIHDYEMAIKTEPHNSVYKDMLNRAQAKAAKGRRNSDGSTAFSQGVSATRSDQDTSSQHSLRPSDDAIKQKLVGYWLSPRHGYLINSDGIIYMLPRKYATTTNRWKVRNGLFYWDDMPHEILILGDKQFVYRSRDAHPATFKLLRSTREEADPE